MNINEMNLEEVEARLAEITSEIETRSGEELETAKAEVLELNERKAELKDLEERKAVAEALEQGEAIEQTTVVENSQKEERKMFELNSVEYRNAWLKALQGKELTVEERAGYTQTGDYSTNAIPTQVSDKFFEKMKKLAPMLSEITLMKVAGNLKFVAEGTRNTAGKHTENSALTAAADTTVSVTLGAFEFMKVIAISKSAKMMSIDAFEGWLVEMLAGDIARAIDNYILNDSTNGVAAITYTTGTNQILNTASTGYTYKNVIDLIALLPAAYDAESKFLCNKATLYGQIANICNSSGQPIFVTDPEVGVGRIMGWPVVIDDYVSSSNNALYLGKWTDVVGNLSEGPQVESDESAGFTSGSIMYRGYASFDSKPAKTDAIVRLVSTTA